MTTKEARKKWVAALRSGKFKQGRYTLRRFDSYCCLGVACEIYQDEVGDLDLNKDHTGRWQYNEKISDLPAKVQHWLGLANSSGGYRGSSLTRLNDNMHSFEEIADLIESEPEGLVND
jgi:hypothetical protein